MPLPSAHVIHETAGRIRIRVPSKRHDAAYFSDVRQKLGGMDGVTGLETNHRTGSILVTHQRDLEAIRVFAEENGLFTMATVAEATLVLSRRLSGHVQTLDDRVIEVTRGTWDLKSIMLIALIAGAGIQIMRKKTLPPALNMIWYALALVLPKSGEHHGA